MNTQLSAIDKLLMASENTLKSVDTLRVEVISLKQENVEIKADLGQLKEHMTIDSRVQQDILVTAKKHITKVLGGKESNQYQNYGNTIRLLWSDYRQYFGITSYKDTRVAVYNDAVKFIRNWEPKESA